MTEAGRWLELEQGIPGWTRRSNGERWLLSIIA